MTETREFPEPGEPELLARARAGDEEAVDRLVTRHQGLVYRFLLGFLRDEDAAADAAQETFVKALAGLENFRGDASFRTWLLAIARNEALGILRSRARRREEPLPDEGWTALADPGPDALAVGSDEVRRIRGAVDRLPKKQRLSVALRLFDGLGFREIGEAIGSSEGSARVNYHYGIRQLREWLHEREE